MAWVRREGSRQLEALKNGTTALPVQSRGGKETCWGGGGCGIVVVQGSGEGLQPLAGEGLSRRKTGVLLNLLPLL